MIKLISIICVYNDEKILNEFLLSSLKMQKGIDYELILLNNKNNRYESAAVALNEGASKAKGEVLVFVHQDIRFLSSSTLNDIKNYVEKMGKGIYGVAGVKDKGTITNIKHGDDLKPAGRYSIDFPVRVKTLDECVIIVDRETFNKLKFNIDLIGGYHLYAVEMCLRASKQNIPIWVLPIESIHHKSQGKLDKSYFYTLSKIVKQYKNVKKIPTTMGIWYTNKFLFRYQLLKKNFGIIKRCFLDIIN
ncbi:hypothetical protein XJ44_04105 [Thermosipho affectus]|uniref:Glycosyltransferase like family protein n=2 Tax=Thermosipho TaxID=2420 RepID=A0A1M5RL24_9BACT|nr:MULTISPECIES: glycosyltransferase [Thermosipho]ONN27378.1 hypothetical protein XJ44_04105 [Thermosipho affectus]SHH27027.1 Glycosyltransferase like family protein [Thermosipho atlanticus DSM 15807]